jgi:hypothetical protein
MEEILSLNALKDPNLPSLEVDGFFVGVSPGRRLS